MRKKIEDIAWSILCEQYKQSEPSVDLNKKRKDGKAHQWDEHYLPADMSDFIMWKGLRKHKKLYKGELEAIRTSVILNSPSSERRVIK